MVASIDLQILLRLKPYSMRAHRLLREYSPQSTVLLHLWYQDALHQEEFEIDCAAILQLKMPLPHHSPRACRVLLQSGDTRGTAI